MHIWKNRAWHSEQTQQLRIPITSVDVIQKRARRVRNVGHMRAVAGEMPDEPAIDRAESKFAAFGTRTRVRHMIQEPGDLGAAEVWIDDEARPLAHQVFGTTLPQFIAQSCRAAVLPDDRIVKRHAGLSVPHDRGFALIGDAHCHEILERDTRTRYDVACDVALSRE